MTKSAEAVEQLLLLTEKTSPDPTLWVLPGPAAQLTHVCYLPETVTRGKGIIFSLWGPAAGQGRGMEISIIRSKMSEHGICNTAERKSAETRYVNREGGRAKTPWRTQVASLSHCELPGAGNMCFPTESSAPELKKNECP